ncbi:C40 family peptidase [Fusibacter sp. 3D3]|uniref:C40 family peptidase n=1 Tax=Fusibacter sp. 3D3 TaxID=1048380 RepID=UPI00085330B7|nr:C40 family peptidase [Fusibacter sp. 3D3]GAU78822.1 cell wall-associated hydrolases invasion-associated proteins [Fusibacter sp. 3D3]
MKRIIMTTLLLAGMVFTNNIGSADAYSTVEVNVDALNIRENNSIESNVIGRVHDGHILTVVGEADDWYQIFVNENQMGYVKQEFCLIESGYVKGTISSQRVNMREKATTSSDIVIPSLSEGTALQVLSKADGWYKVVCDEKTGYIRSDLVEIELSLMESSTISDRDALINFAKKQLGKPYSWGKSGPDSFDCSGFVGYVYRSVYDKDLGHSSSGMSKLGVALEKSELASGDLVFFATDGGTNINHVGIYVGDGNFIHASSSSSNGYQVTISKLDSGFYDREYITARRIDLNN